MRAFFLLIPALAVFCASAGADWRIALPGWSYSFPRDHGVHADFKTEWWYFTGNLRDAHGREFGYQLTFFRQGIVPPEKRGPRRSRFLVDDFKFAHFAISDLSRGAFRHAQKVSRGAFGEAGFSEGNRMAWIEGWTLEANPDGSYELSAAQADFSAKLHVVPVKAPVVHGENGVSQKAPGEGAASHYYSFPRMMTRGRLVLGKIEHEVTGESWFDHEWATNQLAAGQAGWNWFSVQFDDGSELMLYQMRLRNGGIDTVSSGTFIAADGSSAHLTSADYRLESLAVWKSSSTGTSYPVRWKLSVARLGLAAEISTPLANQELAIKPIAYWEGAIRANGQRNGKALRGHGYMELTGYSGALTGLSAPR